MDIIRPDGFDKKCKVCFPPRTAYKHCGSALIDFFRNRRTSVTAIDKNYPGHTPENQGWMALLCLERIELNEPEQGHCQRRFYLSSVGKGKVSFDARIRSKSVFDRLHTSFFAMFKEGF